MISVSNLGMNFGSQSLFREVSLQFDSGKRYGLVGANGTGKSTLLQILAGTESATAGTVTFATKANLGFLRQDHFRYEDWKILHVVLSGKKRLWEAWETKEKLLELTEFTEEVGNLLGDLEVTIADEDGYQAESFASEILEGLGIATDSHHQTMSTLSGGFKLRVLLAQTLFQEPDILLLDEPTNHLDIVSIRWLENFLITTFKGTLLSVSHDRNFLNAVCTHMADIDYETIQLYVGNYDQFLQAKEIAQEQKQKEIESQEKKIAEMQAFVDRFKAKATKARQAQSRVKQMEKMEVPEIKRSSRRYPTLQFLQTRSSGREVVNVKHISKVFGSLSVLKEISFVINRGEKVALIGPNGAGKSTLLKILTKNLDSDGGEIKWGYETHISYFAQDHHEVFHGKESVFEWLYQHAPHESVSYIRGLLGRVLFEGDDVHKPIEALSGGESARVLLAKIMLEKNNIIILDEPTNHLDLESITVLETALRQFEGTVIFVSHDRQFVSNIADRIIGLHHKGIEDYAGSYDEYLEHIGNDYLDRQNLDLHRTTPSKTKKVLPKLSRKELNKEFSRLKKQTFQCEEEIQSYEEEIDTLEKKFSDPNFYHNVSPEEIQQLQTRQQQVKALLEETMRKWELASEQKEEIQHSLATLDS